ncbi:dsRBD fold-containing protein [Mycolicibacterium sp. 050158]|uniref:dsRBD fold-containing protein n=1 Tax=Mycolicibacterium sp. 050158 TaxID=3090602 RepID=UPI00299EDFEA|nr:dsRBD fold-containing protein [Mycolicibacterium sp. 050158]MDX1890814.1 dsRBD fold-containing protein [Mycolicibacterium sp. 050158]
MTRSAAEPLVELTVDEVGDRTRAIARMDWQDGTLVGVGHTRPTELLPDRAARTLAVSRALSDLATRLADHARVGAAQRRADAGDLRR